MRKLLLTLLVFFSLTAQAFATTYYTDYANGSDSNDGLTLGEPWKTLEKANSEVAAGDIVYMRGGDYLGGDRIYPAVSGTSDSARITYQAYNDENVRINGAGWPIVLNGKNYITIIGVEVINCDRYLIMDNGDHNIITRCKFHQPSGYVVWKPFWLGTGSSHNWIHHNEIHDYGKAESGQDYADMIYIGDDEDVSGTNYNLIEYNDIYRGGHNCLVIRDKWNIVRYNTFHNEEWFGNGLYGNRIMEITPGHPDDIVDAGWNLVDSNRFAFTGTAIDSGYSPIMQLSACNNIIRRNMAYHGKGPFIYLLSSDGFLGVDQGSDNYIYNNNFFMLGIDHGGENEGNAVTMYGWQTSLEDNVFKNNVFEEIEEDEFYFGTQAAEGDQTLAGNFMEEDGDPLWKDAVTTSTTNPFNLTYPDFTLQSGSPCIDNGVFLTTITTATGSGTEFVVADPHYFFDGWEITTGDVIQIEGHTTTAIITDVSYAYGTITVDTSLSWSVGDGVSLAYSGDGPDQGAIEYSTSPVPDPPTSYPLIGATPFITPYLTDISNASFVTSSLAAGGPKLPTEGGVINYFNSHSSSPYDFGTAQEVLDGTSEILMLNVKEYRTHADAAYLGITDKAADSDKLDDHDSAYFEPTITTLTHEKGGLEADVSAYNGVPKITGGTTGEIKYNFGTSVAPDDANDDVDGGWSIGSKWYDTTADKEYTCLDNTDGAAVWSGGGSSFDAASPGEIGGTTPAAATFTDLKTTQAYFNSEVSNGNSGSAKTIDWTDGNKQSIITTDDCTITFTPPSGVCNLVLRVIHEDSAVSYTYTWPATVKWPDGSACVTTNTSGSVDIISFYYDGTSYYAQCGGNFN